METSTHPRPGGNGERQGHAAPAVHASRPLSELFKTLVSEAQTLARTEANLARTEFEEKLSRAQKAVIAMVAGGAIVSGGLLVLLFAAVNGLDVLLPRWAAALIVGGTAVVLGAAVSIFGMKLADAERLKPERTVGEAQRNREFAREVTR